MVWDRYEELLSGLGEWGAEGAAPILPLNDRKVPARWIGWWLARGLAAHTECEASLTERGLGRLCSGREGPDAGGAKRRPSGARPLDCDSRWAVDASVPCPICPRLWRETMVRPGRGTLRALATAPAGRIPRAKATRPV